MRYWNSSALLVAKSSLHSGNNVIGTLNDGIYAIRKNEFLEHIGLDVARFAPGMSHGLEVVEVHHNDRGVVIVSDDVKPGLKTDQQLCIPQQSNRHIRSAVNYHFGLYRLLLKPG